MGSPPPTLRTHASLCRLLLHATWARGPGPVLRSRSLGEDSGPRIRSGLVSCAHGNDLGSRQLPRPLLRREDPHFPTAWTSTLPKPPVSRKPCCLRGAQMCFSEKDLEARTVSFLLSQRGNNSTRSDVLDSAAMTRYTSRTGWSKQGCCVSLSVLIHSFRSHFVSAWISDTRCLPVKAVQFEIDPATEKKTQKVMFLQSGTVLLAWSSGTAT